MVQYCRNCGKELVVNADKTCVNCGASAVKATSFCRYCGKPTSVQDLTCPTCGSAIKPIPSSVKALNKENPKLIKLGKIVNLTIVAILVAAYIVFSLPPKVTKPIKATASDAVMATTGYNSLPLHSISVFPTTIPPLNDAPGNAAVFSVHPVTGGMGIVTATQQLHIYALYKNTTSANATKATRFEDVTTNSTYLSSNDKIVTVTSGGLARAVSPGSADITIFYTAAPGSANMSSAAQGKVPITVTFTVPVTVRP